MLKFSLFLFIISAFSFITAAQWQPAASFDSISDAIHQHELIPALVTVSPTPEEIKELFQKYCVLSKRYNRLLHNYVVDKNINQKLVTHISKEFDICHQAYIAKVLGTQFYASWVSYQQWEPRETYIQEMMCLTKKFGKKYDESLLNLFKKNALNFYEQLDPKAQESFSLLDALFWYKLKHRKINAIEFLIENRADVNFNHTQHASPLFNALFFRSSPHFKIAKLLVKNNANINMPQKCANNQTLWQFNCTSKYASSLKIEEFLIENDADQSIPPQSN